jgi:hypothetical protein
MYLVNFDVTACKGDGRAIESNASVFAPVARRAVVVEAHEWLACSD